MMDKERLLKLDVKKIRSNGRYVDFDTPSLFLLSPEEIDFLRHYYKDPTIAIDVIVKKERQKPKKYVLGRSERYSKFKVGKRYDRKVLIPVIMFGTVVNVSSEFIASKLNVKVIPGIYESDGIMYEDPSVEEIRNELKAIGAIGIKESDLVNKRDSMDTQVLALDSIDEVSRRIDSLIYFSSVYHVDFNDVYERLKALTRDFTSKDYLDNHHIEGINYKAKNEEELILYFVRSCDDLNRVDTEVESNRNYYDEILYAANLLDIDPCLLYGVLGDSVREAKDVYETGIKLKNNEMYVTESMRKSKEYAEQHYKELFGIEMEGMIV